MTTNIEGTRPANIDHQMMASLYTDPSITEYICYTDGGCLNNGKSDAKAYGSYKILKNDKEEVFSESRFPLISQSNKMNPGRPTNNMAEALAINRALGYIVNSNLLNDPSSIAIIRSDSELTINQIKGIYKIKNKQLLKISKDRHHILKRLHHKTGRNPWECVLFTKIARTRIFDVLGH